MRQEPDKVSHRTKAVFELQSESSHNPLFSPFAPTIAKGSLLEVLSVNHDWPLQQLVGETEPNKTKIPTKEEIEKYFWIDQKTFSAVRDYISYECHDIRICRLNSKGELDVLCCKRDPILKEDGTTHDAPLGGFWWSIGGRRMVPHPDSPFAGKFGTLHSVLTIANREVNLDPSDVLGVYELGLGRAEFPTKMTYSGEEQGAKKEPEKAVVLSHPQHSMAFNFVVLVKADTALRPAKNNGDITFISRAQFNSKEVFGRQCAYERIFLEAVFGGWEAVGKDLFT